MGLDGRLELELLPDMVVSTCSANSPERIPVKMGVHRIFTVPGYRGCGIVRSLLDEACRHTIYGYKVSPFNLNGRSRWS